MRFILFESNPWRNISPLESMIGQFNSVDEMINYFKSYIKSDTFYCDEIQLYSIDNQTSKSISTYKENTKTKKRKKDLINELEQAANNM